MTQFRSRLGEAVDYSLLLNQGLCCKGITRIGGTGELGYHSCFATGGQYFPFTKEIFNPATGSLLDYTEWETCSDKDPRKNQ